MKTKYTYFSEVPAHLSVSYSSSWIPAINPPAVRILPTKKQSMYPNPTVNLADVRLKIKLKSGDECLPEQKIFIPSKRFFAFAQREDVEHVFFPTGPKCYPRAAWQFSKLKINGRVTLPQSLKLKRTLVCEGVAGVSCALLLVRWLWPGRCWGGRAWAIPRRLVLFDEASFPGDEYSSG